MFAKSDCFILIPITITPNLTKVLEQNFDQDFHLMDIHRKLNA